MTFMNTICSRYNSQRVANHLYLQLRAETAHKIKV